MTNRRLLIEADRLAVSFRIIESGLLEAIDRLEENRAQLERLRGSTARRDLAKAERKLASDWDKIRTGLQRYLAEKKRTADHVAAGAEIAMERERAAEEDGGGQTLMGQLGMALFAWKASNAFDDLAKLSGRKR